MEDVEASLLENVDYAAKEKVEQQDASFRLADQEDIGVEWMRVHGSDTTNSQTNVFAELIRDPFFFHAVHQDLSLASLSIFFIHVFLEACCEMRVSAVPAYVRAQETSFFTSFLTSVDYQGIGEANLIALEFPKKASSILTASCPYIATITPLNLDDFLEVSLNRVHTGQGQLFSLNSCRHDFLQHCHMDQQELTSFQSNKKMGLLWRQGDDNDGSILLADQFVEIEDHEVTDLQSF